MTQASLRTVIQTLNNAHCRYLVLGGLAVVAHGYVRSTIDLDLWLDFDPDNLLHTTNAMRGLGYIPKLGPPLDDFLDPAKRLGLTAEDIHLMRLRSPLHDRMGIELLTHDPISFEVAYARRMNGEFAGIDVPICAFEDLVTTKHQANRSCDLADLAQLEKARSKPTDAELHDPWFTATFEGCELSTLRQGVAWPFADKVAQLEEMHALARMFQEARRRISGVGTIRAGGLIENV